MDKKRKKKKKISWSFLLTFKDSLSGMKFPTSINRTNPIVVWHSKKLTDPSILSSTWSDLEVYVKESLWYAMTLAQKSLSFTCDVHIAASNAKYQGSISPLQEKSWKTGLSVSSVSNSSPWSTFPWVLQHFSMGNRLQSFYPHLLRCPQCLSARSRSSPVPVSLLLEWCVAHGTIHYNES